MRENNKKSILFLHVAVMLFGFSGVLAQYVQVPAVLVAMGRVICSSLLLLAISLVKKDKLTLESKKDYALIIGTGVIMAIHWSSFFQANPGVIGSDRNDHIFYISTVSDVYGAGRVQRKASGEERDQRSDSAGWRVYYGAGIFCGE